MNKVLKEIERIGVYDPLIIELDSRKFYKVGFIIHCNGNLHLDNTIFIEGDIIQNPNSNSNWKIKSVRPTFKYCHFKIK